MTMTSINDIADLVQILQEKPEWRNTIRGLILGEELGNLPRDIATFTQNTNENFNLIHENFKLLHQRFEKLETEVIENKREMAPVNGGYARTQIVSNAEAVAMEMGLEFIRTLTEAGPHEDGPKCFPINPPSADKELHPGRPRNRRQIERRGPLRRSGSILHGNPSRRGTRYPKCQFPHTIHRLADDSRRG